MKKIFYSLLLIAGVLLLLFAKKEQVPNKRTIMPAKNELKEGDIIFQTSLSTQSKAIQMATQSIYSHCGLIYKKADQYYVLEAIEPVQSTPLEQWIKRGKENKYVIKRLKNSEEILTPAKLEEMKKIGKELIGKHYDLTFEWSDEKIYCSELIWKVYKRGANLEVGKLQTLKEFDLQNDIVKKKMEERYGKNVPTEEIVISPVAIFNSDLLITVASN